MPQITRQPNQGPICPRDRNRQDKVIEPNLRRLSWIKPPARRGVFMYRLEKRTEEICPASNPKENLMEGIKRSIPWKFFNPRMVIIQLEEGESKEEAWFRHLRQNPHDYSVRIKIFHHDTTIQPLNQVGCGCETKK
jgi:hypothetical protein